MREETVAQQNAQRISPARIYGGPRAPTLGLVQDVVVHESGDVNEFNDNGKIDMFRIDFAGRTAGQEGKQRTQTLPSAANGVGHIAFDVGIKSGRLLHNPSFNFLEMRLHQLSHSGQRTKRRSGYSRSRGTNRARA